MLFMLLIYMSNYVSIEYYLELVWIGCLQILNARFRQNVICQIVWLHKISTFAFSKSIFFTFAKHCKALLFQKRRWANRYFFSLENQNSTNTIGNTSFIPSPMYISSFIFSVVLYFLHVYLLLCSLSLHELSILCSYFYFVLHLACQVTILRSFSAEFMLQIWAFYLIIIIALYLQTHRYHWNQTPVFCFWWFGNKWMKEFSLLCFSFKNHDCVYGLLIKIQFLTFFND